MVSTAVVIPEIMVGVPIFLFGIASLNQGDSVVIEAIN